MEIEHSKPVPPFVKFCAANIPMVFDDSLSYYEALCALWKWLQTDVIDVINNNATVTEAYRDEVYQYKQAVDQLHDYVENYFDNLDVQEEINNKLDAMVEDGTLGEIIETYLSQWEEEVNDKLATLPVADKSESIVYAFFDETNSHINFYASKDGVKLSKITTSSNTVNTGTDPSLLYKNGKFYMAYSNSSTTYDFSIKVSEDLNTWTQHDINLNLYDASYTRRWAPEWFEDDNGKIYIIISKQYSGTSDSTAKFYPYIAECTDLDTLTFGTAQRMYLSGTSSDNHIDATVCKLSNTYHMFVKSEVKADLFIEHFTSSNLIDWDLVNKDPCRFGMGVEGVDVFKFNGKFYIYTERYTMKPLQKSFQLLSTSSDLVEYTNPIDVVYPDEDLSHGGGVVVPTEVINGLLTNGNIELQEKDKKVATIPCTKDFYAVASRLTDDNTGEGNRLGNYLHLFDVEGGASSRSRYVQFRISGSTTGFIDATYELCFFVSSNASNNRVRIEEISCAKTHLQNGASVAGSLFAVNKTSNPTKVSVYLNLQTANLMQNEPINMQIISSEKWSVKINRFTDDFLNSVDTTDAKVAYANGSENSRSMIVYNESKTKIRLKFACMNATVDIFGNCNGSTIARILHGKMLVNEGFIAYKNFNPDLYDAGQAITATLESYDSTKREYTVLFENVPTSSAFGITIPPSSKSYIVSATAVTS